MDGFTLDELIGGAELAALGREGLCESSLLEALYFESIQNVVEEELRNDEIERIRNEPHELDYWGDAALQDFAADEVITNADVLAFHEYASQFVDEDGVLRRPTGDSLLNIVNINRFGEIEDYLFDLGLIDEISNPDELAEAEEDYGTLSTEEVFEIERELVLDHECRTQPAIRKAIGTYAKAVGGEVDLTNKAALALYMEAKKYAIRGKLNKPIPTDIPEGFGAKRFERLEEHLFEIGLIDNDIIIGCVPPTPLTREDVLSNIVRIPGLPDILVENPDYGGCSEGQYRRVSRYTNEDLLTLYERISPCFEEDGVLLAKPEREGRPHRFGKKKYVAIKRHLERQGLIPMEKWQTNPLVEQQVGALSVYVHGLVRMCKGIKHNTTLTNANLCDAYILIRDGLAHEHSDAHDRIRKMSIGYRRIDDMIDYIRVNKGKARRELKQYLNERDLIEDPEYNGPKFFSSANSKRNYRITKLEEEVGQLHSVLNSVVSEISCAEGHIKNKDLLELYKQAKTVFYKSGQRKPGPTDQFKRFGPKKFLALKTYLAERHLIDEMQDTYKVKPWQHAA
jgi:hypothetical protein